MRPITRLYDTHRQALDAVRELEANQFTRDEITVVAPPGTDGSPGDLVAAIAAGWILLAEARVYAESVRNGRTLVSVRAPFGTGVIAERVLDSFGPASPVIERDDSLPIWDDATPLSSALGLPVLLRNEDSFSAFWGLPLLTRKQAFFASTDSVRALSNASAWFSSKLGLPVLTRSDKFFSSLLGLPLLIKDQPSRR